MSEVKEKVHLRWIDAAKGIAILAVIIDHSTGLLFSSRIISLGSYFSVTVFVFLAGITSFYSSERHKEECIGNELLRKVKGILIPYAIATCIYQLVQSGKIDFIEYINHIFSFDITPPFYFVVFFLQLSVISPYIYRMVIYKNDKVWHCIILFVAIIVSFFCIRHTFVLDVWGGGKYFLGGSYLIIYVLGELFACSGMPLRKEKNLLKIFMAMCAVCLCLFWLEKYEFKLDFWLNEPFGTGLNPPGITLMIYSGCIMSLIYYSLAYIEICGNGFAQIIFKSVSYIGRYSLYIFLFHKLVLDYFLIYIDITNIWAKRVIYLVAMIGFPIVIKEIVDKLFEQMKMRR